MAKYVTLEEIKAQCNVEHDEDNALLQKQLNAAEKWLEKRLQRPLSELEYTPEGADAPTIPEDLQQAILIFAAGLYANREAVSFGSVPSPVLFNLPALYTPYIKFE